MARGRAAQGSSLRFFNPAFYLRRPDRLIFIFLVIGAVTFVFWDRRSLALQYQEDRANNGKLTEEKAKLAQEVDHLKTLLKRKTEELHFELDNDESREFDLDGKDDLAEYEADAIEERKHRAPVLKHVVLDGLKDAPSDPNPIARERRDKVREAMIHAWSSYEQYAWGYDELMPVSKRGTNQFGGLGATIVDALDTLFIMGLHEQFEKATEWVASSLDFDKHYSASVFETSIRVLGGLLSAFDLSKNRVFLTKARDLADRLLPAWNTGTGIPFTSIDLASGNANNPSWTGGSSVLADLATEQVELISLSLRTGDPKYKEKAEKVIKKLQEIMPSDGLIPIYISPHSGQPTTQKITFGAMGDSAYEYMLKVWVLGNKTQAVQHYRDMWERAMEGMMTLLKKSTPSHYLYLAERSGDVLQDKMDELACFAPGMLALGMEGATPQKANQYLEVAEGLAETCYNFYRTTRTKLAGENYNFRDGEDMVVGTSYNILRPETIESLFYLWRRTGNAKYRDWGWDIFQAFESQSRIPSGYVGLHDVQSGTKDDMMQSFFLAETLKYLYLLFSPSSVIPLDEWVFNTEAHPVRIVTRMDYTTDGDSLQGKEESGGDDNHDRQASHLGDGRAQLNRIDRTTGRQSYIRKGGTKGTGQFDYH